MFERLSHNNNDNNDGNGNQLQPDVNRLLAGIVRFRALWFQLRVYVSPVFYYSRYSR